VLGAQSLPWQWSIHDRAYRSITTRCRNHSPGANAPRSEPCGFETAFSMQYPEYRVPRMHLLLTGSWVNKPFSDAPVFGRCHHVGWGHG
jgi:hypothetical protein